MHTHHPDVHEHGLADDCPGCEEIGENPFANADRAMMRQFVELAVAVPREIPESHAQARAVKHVLDALERAGKITEDAPDLFYRYLRDRWSFTIEGS